MSGKDWRWQLRNSIEGHEAAIRCLGATGGHADKLREVVERYPFRVTPYYLSLADPEDENDPVLRQCMPSPQEINGGIRLDADPFEELRHTPVSGLIHRYRDRVVVIATGQCAVYCRHCTRKNTLAATAGRNSRDDFEEAIRYIASRAEIREVIVSGGDPLLMEMEALDRLLRLLRKIEHVEVLRIGTRAPVTLPMRIDQPLCEMLASHRPLWVNTQFNHPAEVTAEAIAACDMFLRSGIPVSNQSVLLKGVNDSVETMRDLCNRLQKNMIRPYYVFQCDPVAGTGHFATSPGTGVQIEEALRNSVGGLSMPRFVADVPGSPGKQPLAATGEDSGRWGQDDGEGIPLRIES